MLDSDNNDTKIYLFVRKNKEDVGAKEFYFLGQMHYTGSYKEFVMKNTSEKAVEIEWQLEESVEANIYEYLIK